MLICKNGVMVDEEIIIDETMTENSVVAENETTDKAQALAEGLSTVTSLAQVREAAKSALEKE